MSSPTLDELLDLIRTLNGVLADSAGPLRQDGFPGAVGGVGGHEDPWSLFVETKRNVTAYCHWRYGDEGHRQALVVDEPRD